jgi:branched-subunit amino acid transport protein
MKLWLPVLAVTVANSALKAIGPLVLGDRSPSPRARKVIALMAPVLLAGLIVVDLGGEDWANLNSPQVLGVGAAGAARLLRAPMLVAVVCGMAVAALLRLWSGSS